MRRAGALIASLSLAGCVGGPTLSCPAGLARAHIVYLFFGRARAHQRDVSTAQWQQFVRSELVPRFPNGFSIVDAHGHWQGPHTVAEEASKEVIIVLPGHRDDQARLDRLRAVYKRQFHQDSVLQWEQAGCAGF